jgi:hypothetical protein
MEQPIQASLLTCAQCGGELHPDEGQIFITCPYCSSTVYLDKSQVVFHWYLAPTLDTAKARASLARWMASAQTVKDLDQKAQILGGEFAYFPMWSFKRRHTSGKEEMLLQPAAATSVSELKRLNLPAGDLRKYDPSLEGEMHSPSVPLQAALGWAQEQNIPSSEITERSLVHIPIYTFKYGYQGKTFTAIVEGATGAVFANIFPAKAEAPYQMIGALTGLVFLCLATFPVIGAMTSQEPGFGIGLLACSGAGIVAAPVLFALAAWIAAKI